jgi:hypothetical protein
VFDDARGSATECAACLDALVAKKLCAPVRINDGKEMLLRVVSMLSKLVDRFEGNEFREDVVDYKVPPPEKKIEDEDEENEDDTK